MGNKEYMDNLRASAKKARARVQTDENVRRVMKNAGETHDDITYNRDGTATYNDPKKRNLALTEQGSNNLYSPKINRRMTRKEYQYTLNHDRGEADRLTSLYAEDSHASGGFMSADRREKFKQMGAMGEEAEYQLQEDANTPYATQQTTSPRRKGLFGKLFAVVGLVGGAFFLSSNMTGNVVGLSSSSSNIIGSVLLVIGLVACFSWVKSKKNSKVVKKKVSKKKK